LSYGEVLKKKTENVNKVTAYGGKLKSEEEVKRKIRF
jgi:hypothetical protein